MNDDITWRGIVRSALVSFYLGIACVGFLAFGEWIASRFIPNYTLPFDTAWGLAIAIPAFLMLILPPQKL